MICVDIEEDQEYLGAQDMFENDDKKELVPSGKWFLYLRFEFACWTIIQTFKCSFDQCTDPKYFFFIFKGTSTSFCVGSTG